MNYEKVPIQKREGYRRLMNNGHYATCVNYQKAQRSDFQFDTGEIVYGKSWDNFMKGAITSPLCEQKRMSEKYVGQKKCSLDGKEAQVIKYLHFDRKAAMVEILYYDGTKATITAENWNLGNFYKISQPERRKIESAEQAIGKKAVMLNNLNCVITKYIDASSIECKFEDGTTVKTTMQRFRNRTVPHPNINTRIVRKKSIHELQKGKNSLGQEMQIIKYNNAFDCTVKFEDGTIVENISYGHFLEGAVENPNQKSLQHTSISELVIFYYMKNFGFKKKSHYSNPCKGFEFDMYNSALQIAIEYDGYWYHKDRVDRDKQKIKACEKSGIRLLRVRTKGLDVREKDDFIDLSGRPFGSQIDSIIKWLISEIQVQQDINFDINSKRDRNEILNWINSIYKTHEKNATSKDKWEEMRENEKSTEMCKKIYNEYSQMYATVTNYEFVKNPRGGYKRIIELTFENGEKEQISGYMYNHLQNYKPKFAVKKNKIKQAKIYRDQVVTPKRKYHNVSNEEMHKEEGKRRTENLRKKYLNMEQINNSGDLMKIIEVNNANDVVVIFNNDLKLKRRVRLGDFKNGKVRSPHNSPEGRLHQRRKANNGEWMQIIEYFGTNNITVRFDDGTIVYHRTWSNFINGKIGKEPTMRKRSGNV